MRIMNDSSYELCIDCSPYIEDYLIEHGIDSFVASRFVTDLDNFYGAWCKDFEELEEEKYNLECKLELFKPNKYKIYSSKPLKVWESVSRAKYEEAQRRIEELTESYTYLQDNIRALVAEKQELKKQLFETIEKYSPEPAPDDDIPF